MTTLDLSALFFASYSLAGTEEDWLRGLATVVRPLLDHGFGLGAFPFRTSTWDTKPAQGIDRDLAQLMFEMGAATSSEVAAQFFLGSRAASASERLGSTSALHVEPAWAGFAKWNVEDIAALTLVDPSGVGVAFVAPSPTILRTDARRRSRLEKVGAHVLAGLRLRRELAPIDAVLSPDGSILHAEFDARDADHRDALCNAVKHLDHVCSRKHQRDPDATLDAWRALISGRWSLVESYESDGRRYLLARRNPPGALTGTGLQPLEAHALLLRGQGASYKLIAYEFDVSVATAQRLVVAGARKLGVRNEAELPALIQACLTHTAHAQADHVSG